jgi:hypothetical protein
VTFSVIAEMNEEKCFFKIYRVVPFYTGRNPLQYAMPIPAKPLIPIKYSKANSKETVVVTKEKAEYVFELDGLSINR